jgi:hypothetical protein
VNVRSKTGVWAITTSGSTTPLIARIKQVIDFIKIAFHTSRRKTGEIDDRKNTKNATGRNPKE